VSTPRTLELLQALLAPAGVSGCESDVADVVQALWAPLADEISLSPLGSVHARLHGNAAGQRPTLMVSAHMDSIGFVVTGFSGGFLRLASAGDFDARLLPGQPVRVRGRRDIGGTLLPPSAAEPPKAAVPVTELLVDCGLRASDLQDLVRVGDAVCLAQRPFRLGESWWVSPRLDNRVSLAALTLCMEALASERPNCDFAAAAVVREEMDDAGSLTSAHALAPAAAVVLDTTFGRTPDLPAHATFPLGAGVTNAWGPAIHPALYRWIEHAAQQAGIPLTTELLPELTQTDADHIQRSLEGVPTALISIPILNMHTPVEIVDLGDVEQAAQLLRAVVRQLGERDLFELSDD